jgi:hypothetical protein
MCVRVLTSVVLTCRGVPGHQDTHDECGHGGDQAPRPPCESRLIMPTC